MPYIRITPERRLRRDINNHYSSVFQDHCTVGNHDIAIALKGLFGDYEQVGRHPKDAVTMNPLLREDQKLLSDIDIHYGPGTRPQVPLPFSVWVRRKYWWWPGSQRYSGLVDRLIIAVLMTPGVVWVFLSFGWVPTLFIVLEAVIICEIFYRVATGTMLGD